MLKTLTLSVLLSALIFAMPALAAENPFALKDMGNLPQIADNHGGKCGEGKCGGAAKAPAANKCGGAEKAPEGKCGGADKAPTAGKCGEGKCGGAKAQPAMQCGGGKCGGSK
ncbi:MAG: hypothetical protein H7842_09030 [Gammaproteobacteria bacterium SHHR-1]